ncbi:hypothetical protein HBI56_035050 [Parastagonospora nodorum]|uniref:Uncharacterized protein n=2 Tax=Phaeosphaeria nodorum (strain SN15 / ATCC MYA-4574 / FGSC 10173) TaxID=321614 RepID=Q0UY76_PHANO|nr:hypothetical protein SNOG_03288 [Parastagonospora nodorum SN15]KAH3920113.1 hypothetical protein HBH56_022860 [Parastagonospora nodorum]EAT90019.1 hypothetical protein SNOG_03288 [Parastagonospora nodorum SN15]KAH3936771.1 hypothetical protein HBH54_011610 [Parastagonospora nodorum]KAH4137252.1 hypothetical protein HBH45_129160 [Parastagonospora nodorum]KAH4172765.1 hypothetical protein HBH44_012050 [Parastagonospora nodorum]
MSQTQTRSSSSHLRIHPTPFKPTFLSIPPSPFSPLLPITPGTPPKRIPTAQPSPQPQPSTSAPDSPLSWMWQCHQCHRNYHLGATRRCLDDGHNFCSGTTTIKAWRKPISRRAKRHRACPSEFDYAGWKAMGRWRRGSGITKKRNCWASCDYPSECRWGRKFGVHTPLSPKFPVLERVVEEAEGVLKPENCKELGGEKADFWGALVASAKRRKSVTGGSPLVEEVKTEVKDGDGDVDMDTAVESSSAGSDAIDMLKDLMKRGTSRRARGNRPAFSSESSSYSVPILTVPKTKAMRTEEDINSGDLGVLLDEDFAPLERVESQR